MAAARPRAGACLIAGSLTDSPSLRHRQGRGPLRWRRLSGLPRSVFGTALAHIGLGVTLIGIVAVTAFETDTSSR